MQNHRIGKAVLVGLVLSILTCGPYLLGYSAGLDSGFDLGVGMTKKELVRVLPPIVKRACRTYCHNYR